MQGMPNKARTQAAPEAARTSQNSTTPRRAPRGDRNAANPLICNGFQPVSAHGLDRRHLESRAGARSVVGAPRPAPRSASAGDPFALAREGWRDRADRRRRAERWRAAAAAAREAGTPLNLFLSVTWHALAVGERCDGHALGGATEAARIAALERRLRDALRRAGVPWIAARAPEHSRRRGSHVHIALHCPDVAIPSLVSALARATGAPPAATPDLRAARRRRDGRLAASECGGWLAQVNLRPFAGGDADLIDYATKSARSGPSAPQYRLSHALARLARQAPVTRSAPPAERPSPPSPLSAPLAGVSPRRLGPYATPDSPVLTPSQPPQRAPRKFGSLPGGYAHVGNSRPRHFLIFQREIRFTAARLWIWPFSGRNPLTSWRKRMSDDLSGEIRAALTDHEATAARLGALIEPAAAAAREAEAEAERLRRESLDPALTPQHAGRIRSRAEEATWRAERWRASVETLTERREALAAAEAEAARRAAYDAAAAAREASVKALRDRYAELAAALAALLSDAVEAQRAIEAANSDLPSGAEPLPDVESAFERRDRDTIPVGVANVLLPNLDGVSDPVWPADGNRRVARGAERGFRRAAAAIASEAAERAEWDRIRAQAAERERAERDRAADAA